jgi:glyoxylase-like metal-dependent hydrolase (beta-lactamase superfamily II)
MMALTVADLTTDPSIRDVVAPAPGETVEIVPGILWLRLPLPFRLNHVNIYIFADQDGWTILDTGIADTATRTAWSKVIAGVLRDRPITKVIVSHFHLDHVGLAGWFQDRFAPAFYMPQTEYLLSRVFQADEWYDAINRETEFFRSCGLDTAAAEHVARHRLRMRSLRTPMPKAFQRLRAGTTIRIGDRDWRILTGGGHAVEQLMLYSEKDRLFISADQVLPEISPNISVGPIQPEANPLGDFLDSLLQIKSEVGADVFTLPGHRRPFFGLHGRIAELQRHHEARCNAVLTACRQAPRTGLDLLPVVFGRNPEPEVIGSAIGEALAHANYLRGLGALVVDQNPDGVLYFRAA